MRFLVLLFVFCLFCGFPVFAACPPGADCSQDPAAWRAMLGAPEATPRRNEIVAAVELKFSTDLGKPIRVTKLILFVRQDGDLLCGSALLGKRIEPIIFKLGQAGYRSIGATPAILTKAGCHDPDGMPIR